MLARPRPRNALACALLLALTAGLALPAAAGEMIRYRTPDGRVGFAGSLGAVPPGAQVLGRRATSDALTPDRSGVPSLKELLTGVRRACEARWTRDAELREHCIHGQSRPALLYRELLLRHPPGTRGREIVEDCAEQWQADHAADLAPVVRCANRAHSELIERHGGDERVLERRSSSPSPAALERDRKRQEQRDRLKALRAEQDQIERADERGRRIWGPRYQKARRELDEAEERTRSIIESMRRRGCRQNTLACGGLGTKLQRARAQEDEKRRYLQSGLREACRKAGCKPGWLR